MSLDVRRTWLSVSEYFLLQLLICETVFHCKSLLLLLSLSSAVILNYISSHFLISLPDSSLICAVPAQRLVILDTIIFITYIHYSFIGAVKASIFVNMLLVCFCCYSVCLQCWLNECDERRWDGQRWSAAINEHQHHRQRQRRSNRRQFSFSFNHYPTTNR